MTYQLPKLSYFYHALEPHIDGRTMEIHYTKHHQTYVTNLNIVLAKYPQIADKPLEQLLEDLEILPFADEKDKKMFRNSAGGHINHSLYWKIMGTKKEIDEQLISDIKKEFGSIEEFKTIFSQTAISQFGSGWAWLVRDEKDVLAVYALPNQDSPYLTGHTPIIAIDVWEHAYYLKYQNRRADYVTAWWNVLKLI